MSNNPGIGGRGKRAPYKTTHYRMPIALKPVVEEMAAKYRELVDEYEASDPALIEAVVSSIFNNQNTNNVDVQKIEKAVEILNEALVIKANVGGAIKTKVRQALEFLHS